MSDIGHILEEINYAEEELKHIEDKIYKYEEMLKKRCCDLILWIMKKTPKKYERKIFSFLYEKPKLKDERGYICYSAKIPDKKEMDLQYMFNSTFLCDIKIDNKIILYENNEKYLCVDILRNDYDRYGDWDGWELGTYILPFEWLDKIDLINTSDDEYVVKTNSDFLMKSLNEKIAYMEKFIEEEKRIEEENYLKRMEEKKKEQEEKEYQQYLELKEKFDKKD